MHEIDPQNENITNPRVGAIGRDRWYAELPRSEPTPGQAGDAQRGRSGRSISKVSDHVRSRDGTVEPTLVLPVVVATCNAMEQLVWQAQQSKSSASRPASAFVADASSNGRCWCACRPRCCTEQSVVCAQYDPVAAQDNCNGIHTINTTSSQERMEEL